MEAVVAFNDFQFNKKTENVEGAFITVPKNVKGLTLKTKSVLGIFSSFSAPSKEGADRFCRRTYARLQNELHCSAGTVCNALHTLTEKGIITPQEGRSDYAYNLPAQKGLRIELSAYNAPFRFKYKDANGNAYEVVRLLKDTERAVYAYFYTYCKNDKYKDVALTKSYADIARELDISERSVYEAIYNLLHAGIITRAAEDKGVNRSKRSTYHLCKELRLRRRRDKKDEPTPEDNGKNTAEKPKQWVSKDVVDADERANRERWYSIRRAGAEAQADKNRKTALNNADYKNAEIALSEAERRLAYAEAFNSDDLPLRQTNVASARERVKTALWALGMDEYDLLPQYHCVKCSDTGFMNDGRACDCYKRE